MVVRKLLYPSLSGLLLQHASSVLLKVCVVSNAVEVRSVVFTAFLDSLRELFSDNGLQI
jgi:hypothetical protein